MSRHRCPCSHKAATLSRAQVLGTAAGAAVTLAMSPLAAAAPAHADLLDVLFDPIIDSLTGALAGLDPLRDLSQAWADSPLGEAIDASIQALTSGAGLVMPAATGAAPASGVETTSTV
ncbi:hypothetical protein, partial [Mycobacterium sp.]|uniref:hypothetical protein n=1 Tax=Mycobacterium sp. TaxID=1785 RepID=UPI00126FE47B